MTRTKATLAKMARNVGETAKDPLRAAAAVIGGAAAATAVGGAFYRARRVGEDEETALTQPGTWDDEIEDEIRAGAIAY
ncbi:hypothetical protein [Sphingomicrobium nitratireducens]|uniref:hypothetical protein n=1 Tax=Sphingomicrobium nitratireducens TaxID=2964666 RepID=UPI0022409E0D|nr:hypothetical protein [Sphingomicrobium nitratireducens]